MAERNYFGGSNLSEEKLQDKGIYLIFDILTGVRFEEENFLQIDWH